MSAFDDMQMLAAIERLVAAWKYGSRGNTVATESVAPRVLKKRASA